MDSEGKVDDPQGGQHQHHQQIREYTEEQYAQEAARYQEHRYGPGPYGPYGQEHGYGVDPRTQYGAEYVYGSQYAHHYHPHHHAGPYHDPHAINAMHHAHAAHPGSHGHPPHQITQHEAHHPGEEQEEEDDNEENEPQGQTREDEDDNNDDDKRRPGEHTNDQEETVESTTDEKNKNHVEEQKEGPIEKEISGEVKEFKEKPETAQKDEKKDNVENASGDDDTTDSITEKKEEDTDTEASPNRKRKLSDQFDADKENDLEEELREERRLQNIQIEEQKEVDPVIIAQNELIKKSEPSSELEIALCGALQRKEAHITRLAAEIVKLKTFISKRKQTYKRKRKEDGAPTRALSAYNIFIQDRFAKLAKENEKALKSDDTDAQMRRVPPASLVASTGSKWKELSAEEKQKYEERAKRDKERYDKQMAQYQPPDKAANRKRNKTGYNMFFSAHVLRLKQTDSGVPSERGSVARLVGTAWKQLSAEDKAYYEREADKHNGANPLKEGEEEDEEEELKRAQMEHYPYAAHPEMHMHGAMPPPMHPGMQHAQQDPRHHAYYAHHMYAQAAYGHYDYSQHHSRHQQARAQGYQQTYPPPRHPYEG